ncbi:MAG: DUF1343 domain-containing protein [Verrucomicrobiae bacterium]|nr:DUF1343 domain-containing protein [Verrucomicrobiae bacterium]
MGGAVWAGTQNAVRLGIDCLADDGFRQLAGKRVGLITNPTGVDRRGNSTTRLLYRAPNVRLVALFAPEHGIDGSIPAGKEFPNTTNRDTGLPVYSLYGPGPTRKPTPAMLKGLDVLVYDLQDTGCRAYTYISTLGLAMEACANAGVEFMVLDRPNPLGGLRVEGPTLNPQFKSFVGQWPIPYLYGLTPGELAQMINGERWISNSCKLKVIKMQGWRRSMVWKDTGLRWIPTSPNVPRSESVLGLAATGLLGEIGGLSIGMGTSTPFECIGAPWLNSRRACAWLSSQELDGVRFEPIEFTPARGMYKNRTIPGVQIWFSKPAVAPLFPVNFYVLEMAKKVFAQDLFAQAVRRGQSFQMFDKVNGTDAVRRQLQAGRSAKEIVASWRESESGFRKSRAKYLLYE